MREYPNNSLDGLFHGKSLFFSWEDLGGIFPRLHLPWPLGGKKLSPRTPPAGYARKGHGKSPRISRENHGTSFWKNHGKSSTWRFDALVRWEHPLSKWWDLDWLVGARPTWSLFFVRSCWCEKPTDRDLDL